MTRLFLRFFVAMLVVMISSFFVLLGVVHIADQRHYGHNLYEQIDLFAKRGKRRTWNRRVLILVRYPA